MCGGMSRRAGMSVAAWFAMALQKRSPRATLSADETLLSTCNASMLKCWACCPRSPDFEDRPEEYGKFFRNMIQQSAGLTEPQGDSVDAYMRQRAQLMNQQGLNAGREPQDAQLEAAWEARRDAFNTQTATGLQNLLPPGAAQGGHLPGTVGIPGDGLRQDTRSRHSQALSHGIAIAACASDAHRQHGAAPNFNSRVYPSCSKRLCLAHGV